MKLFSTLFKHSSKAREFLARSQVLEEYGFYKQALQEAKKCLEAPGATSEEIHLARGAVAVLNGKLRESQSQNKEATEAVQSQQPRS